MFDNKEIGRRIRQIREKEGLNQEELAEKLDFGDRAKVYRIESGKQSMTANELIRFCQLFHISLDSLINNELLSSSDYKEISGRYINNEQVEIQEKREVIRGLYIEIANKDLNYIDEKVMHDRMNKSGKSDEKCANNDMEKLKIDDKLIMRGKSNEYN